MTTSTKRLGAAWLLLAAASAAFGADPLAQDLERAAQLVVALDTQVNERALQGAGVVVARERDAVIVVTADHLVRQGATGASTLVARFRMLPQQRLAARLLPSFDRASDIALLRIDGLRAQGIDPCLLPPPRFEAALAVQRGHGVYVIGNPGGVAWRVPVAPDEVAEVGPRDIRFQSAVIESGHSGGALLNAFGDVVGIVRADQPPYGVAVRLDAVLRLLRGWGVALAGSAVGADACVADARPAAAVASAPATAAAMPADPEAWGISVSLGTQQALPLFLAVQRGDVAAVRGLANRAALEPEPRAVELPLHWAAAFGQVGVMKQLLLMGARKNSFSYRDEAGGSLIGRMTATPLHVATRANQLEAMKVLIAAGAALEEGADRETTGTPLAVAARRGLPAAARLLIAAGADVHGGSRFHGGWRSTPLAMAVASGQVEMVKLLQAAKAPLSTPRSEGGPGALLRVAIDADQLDALRYLLRQRVPMGCDSAANDCDTPLYVAVNGGKLDAARLLLDAGADRNGSTFQPYLHLALERGNLAMLKLLLKAGANPGMKDRDGQTALALALRKDNADAAALLRASGAKR